MESTSLDESIRCATKGLILTQRTQNLELVNLMCDTYAQPIPLSLNNHNSKTQCCRIISFSITYKDRRKYSTLFENVINRGLLEDFSDQDFDIFNIFLNNIISAPKVPRYTYYIILKKLPPEKYQNFWENIFVDSGDNVDVEWDDIHNRNIKCTIETQLRSFNFKVFYIAIEFN